MSTMEGQMDYDQYMKLMSFALGSNGNVAPYVPAAGMNEIYSNVPALPQYMYNQQTAHNYIEFLGENSTYDHDKASFGDIPVGIPLPFGSLQNELLNNDLGKAYTFEPTASKLDTVSCNVMPSLHVPNSNDLEDLNGGAGFMSSGHNDSLPMVRYLKSHNEGQAVDNFANPQLCAQFNTMMRSVQVNKDDYHVPEPRSIGKPAAPEKSSELHSSRYAKSKQRTTETDRRRRLRIAERLKALQELLPKSSEVSHSCKAQTSVMDEVIEYVKYLQFQMKDLSRNKLGGNPLISLEQYGHNEPMKNEALKEAMGNLLEQNPSTATQLLESMGLWVMPVALAEDLLQGRSGMRPNMPI